MPIRDAIIDSKPLQIGYATRRSYSRSWPALRRRGPALELLHWLGSMAAWSVGLLILIGVPLGGLWSMTGPVLGYPFLVLCIVFMPTLAAASRSVRRRRAASVLGYLQQAIRLNLPLNRFLGAAAASEGGRLSREIAELRQELEGGAPLALALAMSVPEMSERSVALIDYAEQMGKLPQTLDRLVREQVGESRKGRENRALQFWYPPLLVLLVLGLIGMLDIFVFPRFVGLFIDFHLPLPAFSRRVFEVPDWLIALLVPVVMLVMLVMLAARFRDALRIVPPSWIFRGIKDRVLWRLPLSHELARDRAMADLCAALADSTELGYPLDQSLLRAQQLELNFMMKRPMERWCQGLVAGRSPAEAAREARMPGLLVGMLATANGDSSVAQVFDFLARFYSGRLVVRRELLRGAYIPAVTLLMGLIVAAVALALFLPMQRLIEVFANRGVH